MQLKKSKLKMKILFNKKAIAKWLIRWNYKVSKLRLLILLCMIYSWWNYQWSFAALIMHANAFVKIFGLNIKKW